METEDLIKLTDEKLEELHKRVVKELNFRLSERKRNAEEAEQ